MNGTAEWLPSSGINKRDVMLSGWWLIKQGRENRRASPHRHQALFIDCRVIFFFSFFPRTLAGGLGGDLVSPDTMV